MSEAPLYFLIAGEPSGDLLGASLIRALRQRTGGRIRFAGIGGEQMAAEGLTSLIPISKLAVMGFIEIMPKARQLLRLVNETAETVTRMEPVALVTIDSSGFCFRVGEKIKAKSPRPVIVHYVAPMVWAWRRHRARSAARAADHLLTLLPFEPSHFEHVHLPATYVGHPVVEGGAGRGDRAGFRRRHGIDPAAPVVCVLPGSRRGEVKRLIGAFAGTVELLANRFPGLTAVVPTTETVGDQVAAAISTWRVPTVLVRGPKEKFDAFAASDAALAASGTVSLELAMAGVPMILGYKVWPITAWGLRRVVKIPHVTLINILLNRRVVPEILQEDCIPEKLAAAVGHLLDDPVARQTQIEAGREALRHIGLDEELPSLRAADKILELVAARER